MTLKITSLQLIEPEQMRERPAASFVELKVHLLNSFSRAVHVVASPVSSETWNAETKTYSVVFGIPPPPERGHGMGPSVPRFERIDRGASLTLSHQLYRRSVLIHYQERRPAETVLLDDIRTLRVRVEFSKASPARKGKSIMEHLEGLRDKCQGTEATTTLLTPERPYRQGSK